MGLGPVAIHSLSFAGTLPFSEESLSWMKSTVPSPGWRGSPGAAAAAASSFGSPGRVDRDARPAPREAAVRRAVHPDAARVVGAVEVDLARSRRRPAVERDHRVAAAVEVVAARQRRERSDPVVPVLAVVGRGVEARRPPAEAVVVRAGDDVAVVERIDVDAGLVLRHAGVVLVGTDVVAFALFFSASSRTRRSSGLGFVSGGRPAGTP